MVFQYKTVIIIIIIIIIIKIWSLKQLCSFSAKGTLHGVRVFIASKKLTLRTEVNSVVGQVRSVLISPRTTVNGRRSEKLFIKCAIGRGRVDRTPSIRRRRRGRHSSGPFHRWFRVGRSFVRTDGRSSSSAIDLRTRAADTDHSADA